jgi:hypothetical protein
MKVIALGNEVKRLQKENSKLKNQFGMKERKRFEHSIPEANPMPWDEYSPSNLVLNDEFLNGN